MIVGEEKNGILVRVSLFPPDSSLRHGDHPFCHIFFDYLDGKEVEWPPYDTSVFTPFQKKVLEKVLSIPRGKVKTYKEIALSIGTSGFRAVARALATNPLPLVIPCHRVVSSRFPLELGGYTPFPSLKKILLEKEKAL